MPQPPLPRAITFRSAVALAVGSMIGAGIFTTPALMAHDLGSPAWLLIVWVIAGVLSLMGALIFAEPGAMFPNPGGLYVYFEHMFGRIPAFLYGWSALAVINTASIAAIAFVCATYAGHFFDLPGIAPSIVEQYYLYVPYVGKFFPLDHAGVKGIALLVVISLTYINHRSVKAGDVFQVVSTVIKVLILVLLAGALLSAGSSSATIEQGSGLRHVPVIGGFVAAMAGAFFAYDGWVNVTFMAGEIKNPERNIPRSLCIGVLVCIAVYLLINLAYINAMPFTVLSASGLVAADAMFFAWGSYAEGTVAALIVICTIGTVNGNIMASSRVTYAMGQNCIFPKRTGETHRRFRTPSTALWLHCIWTCVLIITGSFDLLVNMFVFISWLAYAAGAFGVIVLRKKMPMAVRPYKTWGYPVTPVLFILFATAYLFITVYNDVEGYINHRQPVVNSLAGMVITLAGLPLYFYFRKKQKNAAVTASGE